ncbi:alpha/beta hydrolase [Candidatus Saccharibacteria bacterium]|nr:alpha/beta hydrolase [Candidatus Saccharibacteria bacterium]
MKKYDSRWQTLLHDKLGLPYILHVSIKRKPKKPRATVVFLHGIGNNGEAWRSVISQLPEDIRIISIDLLGHGRSPKPQSMAYNVQLQAKALIATLLQQRALGKVILVGHSMGALISIEVAKRYPKLVTALVLCSPPLYGRDDDASVPLRERSLKKFYNYLHKNPETLTKLAKHAHKFNVMNETFIVDENTIKPFLGALKSSILEQTSLDDVRKLKRPFVIIHGMYDPLVLKSYHYQAVKDNPQGKFKQILAHHDVRGKNYIKTVVKEIERHLPESSSTE